MIDSVSTLPVPMQTGGVFFLAVKCSNDTHSAASNCDVSVCRTYPFHRVSQEEREKRHRDKTSVFAGDFSEIRAKPQRYVYNKR